MYEIWMTPRCLSQEQDSLQNTIAVSQVQIYSHFEKPGDAVGENFVAKIE